MQIAIRELVLELGQLLGNADVRNGRPVIDSLPSRRVGQHVSPMFSPIMLRCA